MAKGYLDVEHKAVTDVILVGHCDLGSVPDDLVSGRLGFKTWAKSEVVDRSGLQRAPMKCGKSTMHRVPCVVQTLGLLPTSLLLATYRDTCKNPSSRLEVASARICTLPPHRMELSCGCAAILSLRHPTVLVSVAYY